MAQRSKKKQQPKAKAKAEATPVVEKDSKTRGVICTVLGVVLVLTGLAITGLTFKTAQAKGGQIVVAYGPVLVGFALLGRGVLDLAKPLDPVGSRLADPRRWIYTSLAFVLAILQAYCAIKVIPNRLPSAALHLWTFPLFTFAMAVGTASGHRVGWWVAVCAGGALMLSLMLVILRILISAAFLAGVYGAFGKAAATFSFVAIALIIQAVALIPIFHIRWLMSKRGRRAFV